MRREAWLGIRLLAGVLFSAGLLRVGQRRARFNDADPAVERMPETVDSAIPEKVPIEHPLGLVGRSRAEEPDCAEVKLERRELRHIEVEVSVEMNGKIRAP